VIITGLIISWIVLRYAGTGVRLVGDAWMQDWRQWVVRRIAPSTGETLALVVLLGGPALLLSLFLDWFGHWLFGLVGLLAGIAVLLYSCGRQDYDAMMLTDPVSDDGTPIQSLDEALPARQARAYVSYERWFGTACWFALLGPVGALFYRCTAVIAQSVPEQNVVLPCESANAGEEEISSSAHSLLGWMDWLPVRLWAACLLLVGDFSNGLSSFRRYWLEPGSNANFLDRVSLAASGCAPEQIDNERVREDQVLRDKLLGLSDRAMWVGLVLLLLLIFF